MYRARNIYFTKENADLRKFPFIIGVPSFLGFVDEMWKIMTQFRRSLCSRETLSSQWIEHLFMRFDVHHYLLNMNEG